MTLKRIQLKRLKGWRMPPNTVKVDRSTCWGNPYKIGMLGICSNEIAVEKFERLLKRKNLDQSHRYFVFARDRLVTDLAGKNLACWCPIDQPCHADVLLKYANKRRK